MTIKKHKIVLDLEHETLKELKRVLFKQGISVQGFFSYIAELVSSRDPKVDSILNNYYLNKEKRKIKSNKNDADTLYSLIEQELKKQNGA